MTGSGLDVAVGRIGRSGRRARWAAFAWAAVMVAIVAPSIGQRVTEPAPPPAAAPPAAMAGPHADPGPLASSVPTPPFRAVVRVVAPPARTSGEDGLMGSLVLDREPGYPFVLWWPGRMMSLAES